MMSNNLRNISIVLVETRQGGNIGAAARAMKNMGLSNLILVSPIDPLNLECRKMAGNAIHLVEEARQVPTVEDALMDHQMVVGATSGRGRRTGTPAATPRQLAPKLLQWSRRGRVAIVFGREDYGLTDSELALCRHLLSIPAAPESPVLNLAQTVLLICYEIAVAAGRDEERIPEPSLKVAPFQARDEMYDQMRQVLIQIGFLSSSNPHHIMKSIRRFLERADLEERDVAILRGIFSQVKWFIEEGYKLPPQKIVKP